MAENDPNEEQKLRQEAMRNLGTEKHTTVVSRDGTQTAVPYSQLAEAVDAGGRVRKGTRIPIMSPEGVLSHVPIEQYEAAKAQDYMGARSSQIHDAAMEKKYGTTSEMVKTAVESGARSLVTFGIAKPQDMAIFGSPADALARAETNAKTALAAEVATTIGTAVVSGGSSLGARGLLAGGARLSPLGLGLRGGLALEQRVVPGMLAKAGLKESGIVSKGLATATAGAVEGAVYGGAVAAREAYDNPDLTTEAVMDQIKMGALFGGTAAVGLRGGAGAIKKSAGALHHVARRSFDIADDVSTWDGILDHYTFKSVAGDTGGTSGMKKIMRRSKGGLHGWSERVRDYGALEDGLGPAARRRRFQGLIEEAVEDIRGPLEQFDNAKLRVKVKDIRERIVNSDAYQKMAASDLGSDKARLEKFHDELEVFFGEIVEVQAAIPAVRAVKGRAGVEAVEGVRAVRGRKGRAATKKKAAVETIAPVRGVRAVKGRETIHTVEGVAGTPAVMGRVAPPDDMTLGAQELWELRRRVDQVHAWKNDPTTSDFALLMRDMRPEIEGSIEDALEREGKSLGTDWIDRYKGGKQKYADSVLGRDIAMDNQVREKARAGTGLLDAMYANFGAMAAASAGGAMSSNMLVGILTGQMHHMFRANKADIVSKAMHSSQRWWNAEGTAATVLKKSKNAAAAAMKAVTPTKQALRVTAQLGLKNKTRHEAYKEKREMYSKLATNPVSAMETLSAQLVSLDEATPQLAMAIRVKAQTIAAHLEEKAPVPNTPTSLARGDLDGTQRVPDSEELKYLNRLVAVEQPSAIIEAVGSLTVTREQWETFEIAYPARAQQMVADLSEELASAEKPPSRYQQVMLSLVMGQPFHPSFEPRRVANFQHQYALEAEKREEEMPSPSQRNQPKTAAAHLTKSQKLSEAGSHIA